jgi:hypothetical protein
MSVVINAVVAAILFGEPFTLYPPNLTNPKSRCHLLNCMEGWDLGAVLVLVAGTVIVGVNAPMQPASTYTSDEMRGMLVRVPFLMFLGGCGGIFAICTTVLYFSNDEEKGGEILLDTDTDTERLLDGCSTYGTEMKQVGSFETSIDCSHSDSTNEKGRESPKCAKLERRAAVLTAVIAATFGCLSVSFSKIVVLLVKTTSAGTATISTAHTSTAHTSTAHQDYLCRYHM